MKKSITWHKDGSGCTEAELCKELKEGRNVTFVVRPKDATHTLEGPLRFDGRAHWIGGRVIATDNQPYGDSITIEWDAPDVPKWAKNGVILTEYQIEKIIARAEHFLFNDPYTRWDVAVCDALRELHGAK